MAWTDLTSTDPTLKSGTPSSGADVGAQFGLVGPDGKWTYNHFADGYQFGDIWKSFIEDISSPWKYNNAFSGHYGEDLVDVMTGQGDGTPVSGSQASKGSSLSNINTGDNSGGPVDITGHDSPVYGSEDKTGFDQASWALEQQWKLDEAERAFNSAEALKQREWEKMMSDTAISRAVQDIKNAGLNPWLALNGGSLGAASTPSGAAASSSSGSSKVPTNYLYRLLGSILSTAGSLISKFFTA